MNALKSQSKQGLIERVCADVLGRSESFFLADMESSRDRLLDMIRGKSFVIAGGGGHIGRAFVMEIARYRPKRLAVIDYSENNLVELVRSARSNRLFDEIDVSTHSFDYGSRVIGSFFSAQRQFDGVFNFAAYKHVRSEREPFSAYQMIETNLVGGNRFFRAAEASGTPLLFSVSTDKAANPVNLMGATKRIMEDLLVHVLERRIERGQELGIATARFANVAFSQGSLPDGWLSRLDERQPLAGPSDVKRYFLTSEEAAQLCLLAAFVQEPGHVTVPAMNPADYLINIQELAISLLNQVGMKPRFFDSDEEALAAGIVGDRYPCVFTPARTSGEKLYEEFAADDEGLRDTGLSTVRAIGMIAQAESSKWDAFEQELHGLRGDQVSLDRILEMTNRLCPALDHVASPFNLDQRM